MTSVWDWILLSIQHRLQGLEETIPSWNAGSRSPCSCSLPALWLPQNRKGRCSGTFPAPPPQTSLLSRSRGPAEASPELHHSQLPPSSLFQRDFQVHHLCTLRGLRKTHSGQGRRGKSGQLTPNPCRPALTQVSTSPELIQALISPGSSLDLPFPCDTSQQS